MTNFCLKALSIALLAASGSALAPSNSHTVSSKPTTQNQRRPFLAGIAGAGLAFLSQNHPAAAAAAKTGAASPWTGDYDDPNHPGCLRQVKVVGAPLRADGTRSQYPIVEVKGYDNGPNACMERPPSRDDIWSVTGQLRGNQASLDFSSKGGPEKLLATYQEGGIVFPDGNKWTKVPSGTPERLPKDMSTLKSD